MSSDDEENDFGYVYVTDVLDLHGTPVSQVAELVNDFLENAVSLGYPQVRIIHGKGKSRLKFLTYQALNRHSKVKDYYDAPPALGGWGATIVEL